MAPHYATHAAIVSGLIGAISIGGYYCYKKIRQNRIPKEWEPVGTVSELYMYPLKSGRRLHVDSAKCTEYGLQSIESSLGYFRDRCLVIYKEGNHEFKTAKTYPKIVFIETNAIGNEYVSLNAPGMNALMVQVPQSSNAEETFVVGYDDEKIFSIDCGDEAAQWVSTYVLQKPAGLRLGYHDGQHRRNIEKHTVFTKVYPKLKNFAGGMYSDLATILLMTSASVVDLQNRMRDSDVTVHNFRPNIVVSGDAIQPYVEDQWNWIKIGDVVLQNVMLCPRCVFTTLNPETAEFSKKTEPLSTMRTYRSTLKSNSGPPSPNMGVYMGMKLPGDIRVGDTVYVGKS